MKKFNKTEKQLTELQLRQLERLLKTKRVSFRESWCVIFSDYPDCNFMRDVIIECEMSDDLRNKIDKEYHLLRKSY